MVQCEWEASLEASQEMPVEHDRRIKEIFRDALHEKLWVSMNELEEETGRFSKAETPGRIAKLNILTGRMLEYDRSFFSESSLGRPEGYRPYFYSYIIHMDPSDTKSYNRLRDFGDKWFIASFSRESSEWHEYQGEIESGASPVIYQSRKLYISDTTLDPEIVNEINNTYTVAKSEPDPVVQAKIASLLKDVRFTSSRVFNVGNGNLINITGRRQQCDFNIMYDVGYHSRQHPCDKRSAYGNAVKSFKFIHPDAVFLSHWDDDHIMGCAYAREELFDCPWFAPEIEKKNAVSAKRLGAYLTVKGNLTMIERRADARKLVDVTAPDSTISFYLGENKRKQTITKENCGGLVIEIRNETNTKITESLFCGDVPYEAVKTVIWDKRMVGYNNLLVPHHGSEMKRSALKVKKSAAAVVCGDGSSNRPAKCHRCDLEASGSGYVVQITGDVKTPPWGIRLDLG